MGLIGSIDMLLLALTPKLVKRISFLIASCCDLHTGLLILKTYLAAPLPLLLGTDPIRPDLAQIDDRIRDV